MAKNAKAGKAAAPAARRKGAAGVTRAARANKAAPHGWPAGLGAFAKAQQEGAKVIETLLKQGHRLEQKTREAAADTAAAARGAAAAKAREVQQYAGGTWDKLEQVFEDRVERALSKLGVYTQNDIQRLAVRVDQLAEAVNRLLAAKGAAAEAPPAKAKRPAKKPVKGPAKGARKTPRK